MSERVTKLVVEALNQDNTLYTLVNVTEKETLNKLYDSSALTLEGLSADDRNIRDFIAWLDEIKVTYTTPLKVYVIKGEVMNEQYGLKGNNAYPDDLSIVSIDLNDISAFNPLRKFDIGARWFDDIVDNNKQHNSDDSD